MPKAVKTTYTAINLETGEVYTGIDAPQSITRGETHFWQASKDFSPRCWGMARWRARLWQECCTAQTPKPII